MDTMLVKFMIFHYPLYHFRLVDDNAAVYLKPSIKLVKVEEGWEAWAPSRQRKPSGSFGGKTCG
jgi:hypothetical protein